MNRTDKFRTVRKVTPARNSARTQQEAEDPPRLLVQHIGKSFLSSIGVGILLLLTLSLVAYFYPDPDRLIRPLALIAAGLTAFAGGFAAVRIHGHAALLCGLLNGSLLTCVMLLLSLCFTSYASGYSVGISCLLHTAFLLLSVAGAYLGLHRGRIKKGRHKVKQ